MTSGLAPAARSADTGFISFLNFLVDLAADFGKLRDFLYLLCLHLCSSMAAWSGIIVLQGATQVATRGAVGHDASPPGGTMKD
jgi:hypothetical protein